MGGRLDADEITSAESIRLRLTILEITGFQTYGQRIYVICTRYVLSRNNKKR